MTVPATATSKKCKLGKKQLLLAGTALLVAAVVILILCFALHGRCEVRGCSNDAQYGDYCIDHVCLYGSCTSRSVGGTGYCYAHQGNSGNSSSSSIYSALEFYDVKVEHNSSYTVATGKVRNNGSRTYRFVEIKGAFKDYNGTTVDTDWTYAVGSEGLAPGESTSFRMSCGKNSIITKCEISIIDYN